MTIKNRIVIIGGNGFIGRNLVKRLGQLNHPDILVADKDIKGVKVNSVLFDFTNHDQIKKIIKKNDIVVHLACTTIPASSEANITKDVEENIIGSIKLLEHCAKIKTGKFIFLSSGGTVYGDHGKKSVKETADTDPTNAHGVMKLAIESYIRLFSHKTGLKYIIIRAGNPFGKSRIKKPQGVIDFILRSAITTGSIEVWGDGSVTRDFIYIEDLTSLIVKTIESAIHNEIINAGTGRGLSLKKIINIIKKTINKKINVSFTEKRIFDLPFNVLNISKAKSLYGWQPKYSAEKAIKIVYNNLKRKNLK